MEIPLRRVAQDVATVHLCAHIVALFAFGSIAARMRHAATAASRGVDRGFATHTESARYGLQEVFHGRHHGAALVS